MAIEPGADILADDVKGNVVPALCRLRQHSGQSIASASITPLTFSDASAEDSDLLGWHSPSSNNTRITPDRTGWFNVRCKMVWAFNTVIQYCDVYLYKNGVNIESGGNMKWLYGTGTPSATNVNVHGGYVDFDATVDVLGDYFEMYARCLTTGSVNNNTNGSTGSPFAPVFSVRYLGPLS